MKRKLKAGRWLNQYRWDCLCKDDFHKNPPDAELCHFCDAQRPRKGFGGGRPRK